MKDLGKRYLFPRKFFYKFYSRTLEFSVDYSVYYPEEDSIFFANSILDYLSTYMKPKRKLKNIEKILEVGCGCGFLSIVTYKFFEEHLKKDMENMRFIAVDINRKAIENAKINAKKHNAKIIFKYSNLFSNVKGRFDLIIFNAPYLPVEEEYNYSAIQKGKNIINIFLRDARNFIKSNGNILLLVSSITPINIPNFFNSKIIKKKKLDWEELRIYKIYNKFN